MKKIYYVSLAALVLAAFMLSAGCKKKEMPEEPQEDNLNVDANIVATWKCTKVRLISCGDKTFYDKKPPKPSPYITDKFEFKDFDHFLTLEFWDVRVEFVRNHISLGVSDGNKWSLIDDVFYWAKYARIRVLDDKSILYATLPNQHNEKEYDWTVEYDKYEPLLERVLLKESDFTDSCYFWGDRKGRRLYTIQSRTKQKFQYAPNEPELDAVRIDFLRVPPKPNSGFEFSEYNAKYFYLLKEEEQEYLVTPLDCGSVQAEERVDWRALFFFERM